MRLLIIITVSSLTAMELSSTCVTNSPMRSREWGICDSCRAILPFSMMESSRLSSAAAVSAACPSGLGVSSFLAIPVTSYAGFDLLHVVGVLDRVARQRVERGVAVELGAQVGELGARLEECAQRLDLLEDVDGAEVVERGEVEHGAHLLAGDEIVLDAQREPRPD